MANRPSPNWQYIYTTYIPLIVLAFWGEKGYRSHLLGEPETTIDYSASVGIITFWVGDPNLNLHLPLASWEGATSKSPDYFSSGAPFFGRKKRITDPERSWCFVSWVFGLARLAEENTTWMSRWGLLGSKVRIPVYTLIYIYIRIGDITHWSYPTINPNKPNNGTSCFRMSRPLETQRFSYLGSSNSPPNRKNVGDRMFNLGDHFS